jgi:hypothetical protein
MSAAFQSLPMRDSPRAPVTGNSATPTGRLPPSSVEWSEADKSRALSIIDNLLADLRVRVKIDGPALGVECDDMRKGYIALGMSEQAAGVQS